MLGVRKEGVERVGGGMGGSPAALGSNRKWRPWRCAGAEPIFIRPEPYRPRAALRPSSLRIGSEQALLA